MNDTSPPLDDVFVPSLWDDPLVRFASAQNVRFVLGALARTLGRGGERDGDEAPALVRTLVSLDAPRGDRVWVTAERGGAPCSLRSFFEAQHGRGTLTESAGLSPWVADLRPNYTGAFEVVPGEFYERAMPHYHGFLHAWTDETHAREGFLHWPAQRQAAFLHEFLLYAQNDLHAVGLGLPSSAPLQEAAQWLRARRRFALQWTVVLREAPLTRPATVGTMGTRMLEAAQALHERISPGPPEAPVREYLETAWGPPPTGDSRWPLGDLLRRAGATEGQRAPVWTYEVLAELRPYTLEPPPDRVPLVNAVRARVHDAARWMW